MLTYNRYIYEINRKEDYLNMNYLDTLEFQNDTPENMLLMIY